MTFWWKLLGLKRLQVQLWAHRALNRLLFSVVDSSIYMHNWLEARLDRTLQGKLSSAWWLWGVGLTILLHVLWYAWRSTNRECGLQTAWNVGEHAKLGPRNLELSWESYLWLILRAYLVLSVHIDFEFNLAWRKLGQSGRPSADLSLLA